jgi:hypothetical protein
VQLFQKESVAAHHGHYYRLPGHLDPLLLMLLLLLLLLLLQGPSLVGVLCCLAVAAATASLQGCLRTYTLPLLPVLLQMMLMLVVEVVALCLLWVVAEHVAPWFSAAV